jgi:23S rRNA A2030 N6-methylase RlmJ
MSASYFNNPEFAMDAVEKETKIYATGIFEIWYPVMKEAQEHTLS